MADRIKSPTDVLVLIPRAMTVRPYPRQRGSADVMKLKAVITRALTRERQEGQNQRRCDDGSKCQRDSAGNFEKLEGARQGPSRGRPGRTGPANTWASV